jgi:hypothetical protein
VRAGVTKGIPLGCSLLLPVDTVTSVQTLKVRPAGYVVKGEPPPKARPAAAGGGGGGGGGGMTDIGENYGPNVGTGNVAGKRVRCAFFDWDLHSRMSPLVPTPCSA